ncbi:uncharacterized protein [Haliotis asinina]|uniref:uncharacterized protein n=1 Tax=Haliotis asinina TaxID=109174 RepID=UPI0035319F26
MAKPPQAKRARMELTLNQKLKLIEDFESVPRPSQKELAFKYQIARQTVSDILKKKDFYQTKSEQNISPKTKRFNDNCKFDRINKLTYSWFLAARSQQLPISGPILKERALQFASQLDISDFKASDGWLASWKTRHDIKQLKVSGESASVNTDDMEEFRTGLDSIHCITTNPPLGDTGVDSFPCLTTNPPLRDTGLENFHCIAMNPPLMDTESLTLHKKMSVVVKAFLERDGNPKAEIRRFGVPADASASFTYIFMKVSEVFPGLVTGNFNLFWKDSDGDLVCFSSDEELMEALGFVTDSVFRIYVREHALTSSASRSGGNGTLHPSVVCNACKGAVHGIHYKRCVCPDYDLCRQCGAKKIHWHNPHGRCVMETDGNVPPRADSGPNQDGEQDSRPEEEHLHNVGENVETVVDPFGVHVNFEAEDQGHHRGGKCHGSGQRSPKGCGYRIRHYHRRCGNNQDQDAGKEDGEMREEDVEPIKLEPQDSVAQDDSNPKISEVSIRCPRWVSQTTATGSQDCLRPRMETSVRCRMQSNQIAEPTRMSEPKH